MKTITFKLATENFINLFLLVFLLMVTPFAFSQPATSRNITVYQYRIVPPDKINQFIKRETTYYSEIAKKAMEKGNLQFWALLQKVGGNDIPNSPNFLFVNTYKDIDRIGDVWSNAAAVFPKIPVAQIETESLSKVTATYFLADQAWEQSGKAGENDFNFIKFNYLSSSDPSASAALEKKYWQPFIKNAMENAHTTQIAWGNAILLSPTGDDMDFNIVAYDIYSNLKEALYPNWNEKTVFPNEGLTEIGKLEVKPRSSEVYQIIKSVSATNTTTSN
ncbi:MAG: hypothetical protein ABIR06_21675 [Cyclobacteriaceae bacterium]